MGPGPLATSAGADLPEMAPARQVVLDQASATIEVPLLLGPATGSMEWILRETDVPDGVRNVGFEVTRTRDAGAAVEDRCQVFHDGKMLGEARFSGGDTYGLTTTTDSCAVRAWELEPGTYTAVYVLDEVAPMSSHTVELRVVADLDPWRPAQW